MCIYVTAEEVLARCDTEWHHRCVCAEITHCMCIYVTAEEVLARCDTEWHHLCECGEINTVYAYMWLR